MSRTVWRIAFSLLLFVSAAGVAPADSGDPYQAEVIVTGQGEASRQAGFAKCLVDVLVKVSGDPRVAAEPEAVALAGNPGDLVAAYRFHDRMSGIPVHDEQGSRDRPYDLTVSFVPARIDAALRSLGREPWAGPRPRLVLFLTVRNGSTAFVLSADGERGRSMREALAAAAARFAMPVILPSLAVLAEVGLDGGNRPPGGFAAIQAMARAAGGDLAIGGDLVWDEESPGWIADWRLEVGGKSRQWRIRGVGFDQAFLNAIGGAMQILSGHGWPE